MSMTAKIENNKVTITLDLQPPTKSSSGKTLVVASTHGNQKVELNGETFFVGVNVYKKP